MKKDKITVERLKALVQEYITLRNDEMENSTEWAYVMLEPDLQACEEVTLNYLMQINEEEFVALGDDQWFDIILSKFKSAEVLNVILAKYANFFGEDTTTPFYQDSIEGLHNYVKG